MLDACAGSLQIKAHVVKSGVLDQLTIETKLEVMLGVQLMKVSRCTPSVLKSCVSTGFMQSDRGHRWWFVQMQRACALYNDVPWQIINSPRLSHWQADKASSADKGSNSEITGWDPSQAKVSCPQA